MRFGQYTLTLPGNPEYSVPQLRVHLCEIEQGTGIKVSVERWLSL